MKTIQVLNEKPLFDEVWDFFLENQINNKNIKIISNKTRLSENYIKKIIQSFDEGTILE